MASQPDSQRWTNTIYSFVTAVCVNLVMANVRKSKSHQRLWFFKLARMRTCRFTIQILEGSRKPRSDTPPNQLGSIYDIALTSLGGERAPLLKL